MAYLLKVSDNEPFDEHIKNLKDDELLDFWAETQQIEQVLRLEYDQQVVPAFDYEKLILLELQIRSAKKQSTPFALPKSSNILRLP